jgi:hypothetical protein
MPGGACQVLAGEFLFNSNAGAIQIEIGEGIVLQTSVISSEW